MPTYVYEVIDESSQRGERFEVVQAMSDPPLTHHPATGKPVRRVIMPPQIAGRSGPQRAEKNLQNDDKLARMGFTKYVKSGDGTYEKTTGDGPDMLKR